MKEIRLGPDTPALRVITSEEMQAMQAQALADQEAWTIKFEFRGDMWSAVRPRDDSLYAVTTIHDANGDERIRVYGNHDEAACKAIVFALYLGLEKGEELGREALAREMRKLLGVPARSEVQPREVRMR